MKLAQLYTPEQVDDFIDKQICRDDPTLRARAESRKYWRKEQRAADPKLDAVLKALKRRKELVKEISKGRRDADGHVNVRV